MFSITFDAGSENIVFLWAGNWAGKANWVLLVSEVERS